MRLARVRLGAVALACLLLGCAAIVGVPPVDITGTVRGEDGRPIENATVALETSFWAPLCCRSSGVLQLTRTGPDGRYRFVADADRDFHFAGERRSYRLMALREGYAARRVDLAALSKPFDLVLAPKEPSAESDCLQLCPGDDFDECRRVAQFHFGDKTRCDDWFNENR